MKVLGEKCDYLHGYRTFGELGLLDKSHPGRLDAKLELPLAIERDISDAIQLLS